MPTANVTVTATFCPPNEGHTTLTATGAFSGVVKIDTSELQGNPGDAQVGDALIVICRRVVAGLSNANKKSAAANGIAFAITFNP